MHTVLKLFEKHQYDYNQRGGYERKHIQSHSHCHTYGGYHPYSGGSGETSHRAFALNDGSGSKKAYPGDDLCSYTSRVAVLKSEVFLWYVYGQYHGEGCPHGYKGECAYAGNLSLAFALQSHAAAQYETEQQLVDRRYGGNLHRIDGIVYGL